jgi:hypothetical protein
MLNLMQFLLIFLFPFFSFQVLAGPFGLEQGMSLEQIKKITKLEETDIKFVYRTINLPKGTDEIHTYTLIITPTEGLCKINAFTRDIPTSPDGKELRDEFDSYVKILSEKYGSVPASNKQDFLHADSIWKDSKYWMRSLGVSERTLAYFWFTEKSKPLPDSISAIQLKALVGANAISPGFLVVGYEFNNSDKCMRTIKFDSKNTKKEKLKSL